MRATITAVAGLSAILSFLILPVSRAWACSLSPYTPSEEQYFQEASSVFLGTAKESTLATGPWAGVTTVVLVVTFDVEHVWKGVQGPVTQVTTARDATACGYPFSVGTRYLVFASGGGTSLAMGTRVVSTLRPQDLLPFAGPGQPIPRTIATPETVAMPAPSPTAITVSPARDIEGVTATWEGQAAPIAATVLLVLASLGFYVVMHPAK